LKVEIPRSVSACEALFLVLRKINGYEKGLGNGSGKRNRKSDYGEIVFGRF
jgi:hypothetical protein